MTNVIIQDKGILQIDQGIMSMEGSMVFGPEDVSTAVLNAWYDFADASTLFQDTARTIPVTADGQNLRSAADKSGNGHHLVDSPAQLTTYHTSVQNGNSVLRTNGDNGAFMENSSAMVGAQPITIFAVGRWRTIAPTAGYGAYMVSNRNGNNRILIGLANVLDANVGQLTYQIGQPGFLASVTNSNVLTTWTGNAGLWYEITMELNGAAATNTWVGNTPDLVNVDGLGPSGQDNNFGTGIRLGQFSGDNHGWNSDIGEVLIYDGLMNNTDRTAVTNFLTTKWATTIS